MAINYEMDIVKATLAAMKIAKELEFSKANEYLVGTSVSELARNIIEHGGGRGTVTLSVLEKDDSVGIEIIAEDEGPGIQNLEKAMEENFSTSNTLGVGLPGTQRLVDEFLIESKKNRGLKVAAIKWK